MEVKEVKNQHRSTASFFLWSCYKLVE